ncbi:cytochrome b5 reductase 4 [Hetaerina americana]|uniref:cytochrome b5 reductase 4 n=1 Tax=Hetaerina americana TaxID=62018 RepID=UPI003A7F51EE
MPKSPIMACNESMLASNPRGDGHLEIKPGSGSATGTIRNKVALKPGHSLLDWIKLGHSGKDLTGVGGVYQTVTLDELSKHNKREDAWIAIKGQVFNITDYLDFHPGGPEELLRGVGMDATKLFNEVHPWVNVESMLQKCLVGRLKPSKGEGKPSRPKEGLSSLLFSRLKKTENSSIKNGEAEKYGKPQITKPSGLPSPLLDWLQKAESFTLVIYTRRPGLGDSAPSIRVTVKEELKLEVKLKIVKNGIYCSCVLPVPLVAPVIWPCSISLIPDIGKVEIVLQKKFPQIWQYATNPKTLSPEEVICKPLSDFKITNNRVDICSAELKPECRVTYQPLKVMNILPVNHDTKLFVLKHSNDVCDSIPIGYHVLLQATVEGETVERNYTPVIPAIHSDFWPSSVPTKRESNGPIPPEMEGNWLCLLIKSTEGGVLSPWLCDGGISVGDTLMISECIAPTVECEHLMNPPPFHMGRSPKLDCSLGGMELLLLAAGTGITPMVRIIQWALQISSTQCKKVTLIFFNKTENDIIWREQLDKLMAECNRFTVRHVLSNANDGWIHNRGIIRRELLEPYFTSADGKLLSGITEQLSIFTCICGPIPFTRAAEKILLDFSVKTKDFFSFLG